MHLCCLQQWSVDELNVQAHCTGFNRSQNSQGSFGHKTHTNVTWQLHMVRQVVLDIACKMIRMFYLSAWRFTDDKRAMHRPNRCRLVCEDSML